LTFFRVFVCVLRAIFILRYRLTTFRAVKAPCSTASLPVPFLVEPVLLALGT
jgi:hypothetical protein